MILIKIRWLEKCNFYENKNFKFYLKHKLNIHSCFKKIEEESNCNTCIFSKYMGGKCECFAPQPYISCPKEKYGHLYIFTDDDLSVKYLENLKKDLHNIFNNDSFEINYLFNARFYLDYFKSDNKFELD